VETVGNYSITVSVTLIEYPEQTAEFVFYLEIKEPFTAPDGVEVENT
jgi:hypothetical protein